MRLFIAQAPRFRDFARLFAQSFPRRGLAGVTRVLSIYADRGALSFEDPQFAAEQFAMLVIGVPQRLAMLGYRDPPEQEARRMRAAVKLFLDGCRANRDASLTASPEERQPPAGRRRTTRDRRRR